MIEVEKLCAFYDDFQALFDVSISVEAGETVALIGANGAGKSTLLRSLAGLTSFTATKAVYNGGELPPMAAELTSRLGITLVPEGRRMFQNLTVKENIQMGLNVGRRGPWTIAKVFDLFPILEEFSSRPAALLSGGQQQMIALARALVTNPSVLLLDEVSLGLAPVAVDQVYQTLAEIKNGEIALVIVEQDIKRALDFSDRFYCLLGGTVSLSGTCAGFPRAEIGHAYFGDRP